METKMERSNTVHNILFNESVWHAVKMRANKANLSKKKSKPKLDANANNMVDSLNNSTNSITSKRLSLPLDMHFKERFLSRISLTPKLTPKRSPSIESSEPTTPVSKSFIRKSFVSYAY